MEMESVYALNAIKDIQIGIIFAEKFTFRPILFAYPQKKPYLCTRFSSEEARLTEFALQIISARTSSSPIKTHAF